MSASVMSWRNARLPKKTAFFAVGDIHSHSKMLRTILNEIETGIANLPQDTKIHVVFLGDYVDRGPSAPDTINALLEFEERFADDKRVHCNFLCGNHEEYLARLLDVTEIIEIEPSKGDKDFAHAITQADGKLGLEGLEDWLFSGGGHTTLQDYLPWVDTTLFDFENNQFSRSHKDFSLRMINRIVKDFIEQVPQAHKQFWNRVYYNNHLILGDYLFVHAGVDPSKTLEEQGIGESITPGCFEGTKYLEQLMIRNRFLWRDHLPNCPYIVIHGHTPSTIDNHRDDRGVTVADGQKDYRLCLDTGVYTDNGALTCFFRYGDDAHFIATTKASPGHIIEYGISQICQLAAQEQHQRLFPHYHFMFSSTASSGPRLKRPNH